MSASSLALAAAVVLTVVYMGLSIAAVPCIKPELRKRQADWLHALMLWWPFNSGMYDGSGRAKALRLSGLALLPVITVLYIISFLADHGA